MTSTPASVGARVSALDGLRGLVIISVVVNHAGGVLWPRGGIYDVPVLRGLLGGGAVVVFFVVGGFIVTRGLLKDTERGALDPARFYLRRLVRLWPQLAVLCVAVWTVLRLEPVSPPPQDVANSATHVMTFTLNLYANDHLLSMQPEFGHLWYLSVQQQCYLVLPLVIVLLGRRRIALVAMLLVLIGLVFWQRQEVLDSHGWVIASSRTTTRADGLLWGVALAVALPWLARVRRWGAVLAFSLLALLVLKLVLLELPPMAYLGAWSLAFTAIAGVVVVAIWQLPAPTRVSRLLSWRPLARLGRSSLAIYLWHVPIILVLSRHTSGWTWPERTALALLILAVIVVVMERWVDEPVRRWLATGRVFRLQPA